MKTKKNKSRKNKSRKNKRGGAQAEMGPAHTKEELILIINNKTNKISPMNTQDLIVAKLIKQKTLNEYDPIKIINKNTINNTHISNNNNNNNNLRIEELEKKKRGNHNTKMTFLGKYNYSTFKIKGNYIIYDKKTDIFREYIYSSSSKFIPINKFKYTYKSGNTRTNENINKTESKITLEDSIDPNNLLNETNTYSTMQKLIPLKVDGKIQKDIHDQIYDHIEKGIQNERYEIYKIPE